MSDKVGAIVMKVYEHLDQSLRLERAKNGIWLKCKEGCSHCCYENLEVMGIEIAPIIDAINEMTVEQQRRLGERGMKYLEARKGTPVLSRTIGSLEEAEKMGMKERMKRNDRRAWNKQTLKLAKQHRKIAWETATPCPFLEENKCSIYEARPYACRTMGSVYEPDAERYRIGKAQVVRTDGMEFSYAMVQLAERAGKPRTDVTLPQGTLVGVMLKLLGDDFFEKLATQSGEDEHDNVPDNQV